MKVFLLRKSHNKETLNDSESTSGTNKDNSFKFDLIKETLKRTRPRSKLKSILLFILYMFYSCQISIIFISLILGVLTLGLPLLLIYNGLIINIIFPILFICIFTLIFSLIIIIIHIVDRNINKSLLIEKWERKNFLKNFGLSITLLILIISVSIAINFYSKITFYVDNDILFLDNNESIMSKEIISDFFFKYILNMIYFSPSYINQINEKYKIKYFVSEDYYIDILRYKIKALLIPLMIISFNKTIKCIFIEVKFSVEQFLFFFGTFIFFIFNIILNNYKIEKIIEFNINSISFFQIISLGVIYVGYISWILHSCFRFIGNPKDKSFSIRKYTIFNSLIILFFDLISLIGASLTFLSILFFYFSIIFEDENFKNLKKAFILLKIGFLIIIIGNSYYFGHYLLSIIFRPISIQYTPYELKNKSYIKANKKLSNAINIKRNLKLREVLNKN